MTASPITEAVDIDISEAAVAQYAANWGLDHDTDALAFINALRSALTATTEALIVEQTLTERLTESQTACEKCLHSLLADATEIQAMGRAWTEPQSFKDARAILAKGETK